MEFENPLTLDLGPTHEPHLQFFFFEGRLQFVLHTHVVILFTSSIGEQFSELHSTVHVVLAFASGFCMSDILI